MLKGKTILIGISGGIAVYKVCTLVSSLVKLNADVRVVMTKNATEFVSPLTFETLSGNRVVVDTFDRNFDWQVEHISLAKKADIAVIAPATANIIGKIASGIADDFLTTTLLAIKKPILIAPAMNTEMLKNTVTTANIAALVERGMLFQYAKSGRLACGDQGEGRLAEPEQIQQKIIDIIMPRRDFVSKSVLVTLGATIEDIDGVRFISNYSSGKMGAAIARACQNRGGRTTIIAGKHTVPLDFSPHKLINVVSTQDMYDAVLKELEQNQIIIKAAAPADYRVQERFKNKLKLDSISLRLTKNPDIAKKVGEIKTENQRLIVFCAETTNLIESAKAKLISKNADLVIANDLTKEGAGFGTDTNIISIISKNETKDYPKMLKTELADIILDEIAKL